MIRIKISIGIIAAIIVLGAVGFFMLKNETDEIIAMLDETRELSDKEKKEEALESVDALLEEWDKFHTYASVFVNNDKISATQNSMSRLKALIETDNDELNAEYDTGVRNTMNITCLIRDVVNIVSEYLNIELQEESLHYARFITHLKFLGQRIFRGQMLGDDDNGFGKVIAGMYPVEYACSEKIAHYIKMRYDHEITDEETAYLAVHIRRIQPEKEKELDEDLK